MIESWTDICFTMRRSTGYHKVARGVSGLVIHEVVARLSFVADTTEMEMSAGYCNVYNNFRFFIKILKRSILSKPDVHCYPLHGYPIRLLFSLKFFHKHLVGYWVPGPFGSAISTVKALNIFFDNKTLLGFDCPRLKKKLMWKILQHGIKPYSSGFF